MEKGNEGNHSSTTSLLQVATPNHSANYNPSGNDPGVNENKIYETVSIASKASKTKGRNAKGSSGGVKNNADASRTAIQRKEVLAALAKGNGSLVRGADGSPVTTVDGQVHDLLSSMSAFERNNCDFHPTAIISDKAQIFSKVRIGPFCIVGEDVVLEEGVELKSHVTVTGFTRIGT